MQRRRAVLTVKVDLDPVPGTFHQPEDHVRAIQRMLDAAYPHYRPEVDLDFVTEPATEGMVDHEFDSGYSGMSTFCNHIVLDDEGYGTTCNKLHSAHLRK